MQNSSWQRIVFPVLFIGALLVAAYFYSEYQAAQEQLSSLENPAETIELSEAEIAALLEQVSVHIILPEEEPVIATVANAEELADQQAFFIGAQNGDRVIIFPQAQKAMLYSPERDVLVNVGPLYFPNPPAEAEGEVNVEGGEGE